MPMPLFPVPPPLKRSDTGDYAGGMISGQRTEVTIPSGGTGTITVTTEDASGYAPGSGVPSVANVDTLTFDQDNFEIFDGGGGQCVVKLKTCPATCPPP